MKKSFIYVAAFAAAAALLPGTAFAQSDQTTAGPMATATVNPGDTANPMVTTAPESNTYSTTTSSGNNGWWGLIGLIGLLGLFGARRSDRTTTIT